MTRRLLDSVFTMRAWRRHTSGELTAIVGVSLLTVMSWVAVGAAWNNASPSKLALTA